MTVSKVEVVCRSEAQRLLTALRATRKHSDLNRGWRDFEQDSPFRKLSEWQHSSHNLQQQLPIAILLQIVRSSDFGGLITGITLDCLNAVAQALVEEASGDIGHTFTEIVDAVSNSCSEETYVPTDLAAVEQMVSILVFCATARVPRQHDGTSSLVLSLASCKQVFDRLLTLWVLYRQSAIIQAVTQDALHEVLDAALPDIEERAEFLDWALQRLLSDLGADVGPARAILYMRCVQQLMTRPEARTTCAVEDGPCAHLFHHTVPLTLHAIAQQFSTNMHVVPLLLPLANQVCWQSIACWEAGKPNKLNSSLGALQLEAMLIGVYLRSLNQATAPLLANKEEAAGLPLSVDDGLRLLLVILESMTDLLQPEVVVAIWCSFDVDWKRPAVLGELLRVVVTLLQALSATDRLFPASVSHAGAAVLARLVAAFSDTNVSARALDAKSLSELARIHEEFDRRHRVTEMLAKMEESPKKARKVLESSGILDFIELPAKDEGSDNDAPEWALKLTWLFRCWNHGVPYGLMGECFGQPNEDAEVALKAFVDTFNFGRATIEQALRNVLEAFLLPKESQQIDRILQTFARRFYHTQPEQTYLRHEDAAYVLAFSIIMLNVDQHNPRLKKRMVIKDFISTNRGINDGENIPQDVLTQIFESIRSDEIKTPSSGSLSEFITRARWKDLSQLVARGYRDNAVKCAYTDFSAHSHAFVECFGKTIHAAFRKVLEADPGSSACTAEGLEALLELMLAHEDPEADAVADDLVAYGTEIFYEPQVGKGPRRAQLCLRGFFRAALRRTAGISLRQRHLLVYLTVQFCLYGLFDQVLAELPSDASTSQMLHLPCLEVDPPTGVVYSVLRTISGVPFKIFSFAEDRHTESSRASENASMETVSETITMQDTDTSGTTCAETSTTANNGPGTPTGTGPEKTAQVRKKCPAPGGSPAAAMESSWDSLQHDPLRPQITQAFDLCKADSFLKSLVQTWQPAENESNCEQRDVTVAAARVFMSFLSSLLLVLKTATGSKAAGEQELPWRPEGSPNEDAVPGTLYFPKRVLALNILDGYEILRLALQLVYCTLGCDTSGTSLHLELGLPSLKELSVCAHVGLFHTLRRQDLSERTLSLSVVGLFQVAATLLPLEVDGAPVVSVEWPVRLLDVLVQRCEQAPHLLVSVANLCLETVRLFVTKTCTRRRLDSLELWRQLFLFLFKATPTTSRALWPAASNSLVESVQTRLWDHGLSWLLCHPQLLDSVTCADASFCKRAEEVPSQDGPYLSSFLLWCLDAMAPLAEETFPGNKDEANLQVLRVHEALLKSVAMPSSSIEDDADATQASATPATSSVRLVVWARLGVAFLKRIGPLLASPPQSGESERSLVPILKRALLGINIPALLASNPGGAHGAGLVLETLVSNLASIERVAPLSVLRDGFPVVAKFFLLNLQVLRQHAAFGQLWVAVLQLVLRLRKRGVDAWDSELAEVAAETLRNLLYILLSSELLAFVEPAAPSMDEEEENGSTSSIPRWWSTTWYHIEASMPGFAGEFRTMFPEQSGAFSKAANNSSVLPLDSNPEESVKMMIPDLGSFSSESKTLINCTPSSDELKSASADNL